IMHNGGLPGFRSNLLRLPDEKFTVVILANAKPGRANTDPENLARQLVEIYLGDKFAPLPSKVASVPPESYDDLTGRYELQGKLLTVSRRGTQLFAHSEDLPEQEIFPQSTTEFFRKEVAIRFTFVRDSGGKAVKLIYHNDDRGFDFVATR